VRLLKGVSMQKVMAVVVAGLVLSACSDNPYTGDSQISNTTYGLAGGAAVGAGVGAIVGKTTKVKTKKAMMIGAGVGALAGGAIGLYMDRQEAQLRQQLRSTGVSVSRYGNQIVLNMPSHIMFSTNQSTIRPQFRETLNSVALVLSEYSRSRLSIVGHTDSQGDEDYNEELSQMRAGAVSSYLARRGINPGRFTVEGHGENEPIASNASVSGRRENRRVEITINPT
jgi:outer membrane protein OmpA-like peptidoglycan-associated protein